jgi:hypothetical protein
VLLGTFQSRPQATSRKGHLTRFFFYFFPGCDQSCSPKAPRLFARQRRTSVAQGRIPFCCRKQEWTRGGFSLALLSVFEKEPKRALSTWKQPAWLDHLNQNPAAAFQRCWDKRALCNWRRSFLWDYFVELREMTFKKWLSEWEQSGTFFFFQGWAQCSLVFNAKFGYKMKQEKLNIFSNCLHVASSQSAWTRWGILP